MSNRQHYEKPPITEAIVDLRVNPRADLDLEVLRQLSEGCHKEYPQIKPIIEATGSMKVKPGESASASAHQEQTGFRSVSSDEKYICQRQLASFTLSCLAPYDSWEPFRDVAREAWTKYRQATTPTEITRLAVRFINRIDIPETSVDLKRYFRTSPEISSDLPQTMAGFFMQVQLPQDDLDAQVIINQTIVPPPRASIISVILDLDVFRAVAVPQNEDEIWNFFESLHERKNSVFEACIEDRTRELFQ